MAINIKGTHLRLTADIIGHLNKKIRALDKFIDLDSDTAVVQIEIERERKHRKGEVFRAEITIKEGRKTYRAESRGEDVMSALDAVKETIVREVRRAKEKAIAVRRKGEKRIKRALKKRGK